jgi:putative transcriptional regulator
MKADHFAALLESTQHALEHAQGKRELRTTTLPRLPQAMGAEQVRALRERVNASQSVFAHFLNVSTKLVQAWEADRRSPEGAALRLLELGAANPRIVFRGLPVRTAEKPVHAKRPRAAAAGDASKKVAAKRRSSKRGA